VGFNRDKKVKNRKHPSMERVMEAFGVIEQKHVRIALAYPLLVATDIERPCPKRRLVTHLRYHPSGTPAMPMPS
jgi:hypothetical protein